MNFLEIINKCLCELNYKQVGKFSELTKNDHQKIKNILNIINSEICTFDNWNFLLRKQIINLPKNTTEVLNTVNGKINTLCIDGKKLEYTPDFENFMLNKNTTSSHYSVLNDLLLFQNTHRTKQLI